jgi:glycosyltransferase involved in cell wall biosynthesis
LTVNKILKTEAQAPRMKLRLFSHVNADSDLIEAWLNYYLRLGVDWFHLVVHGPPEENEKLLAIKDSYPITIEDTYEGPFPAPIRDANKLNNTEKKNRLDALLARHTGQWVLLVDSDEFVEFPYQDIPETIRKLESANANLMAAPMLQRLRSDGSLDSPPVIDDPFPVFPLCSLDLYWRMGVRADVFKFPLFYCASGTELLDEGNHHPPRGLEPKASAILGVTHHFKFRRVISRRLEKRINSAHSWKYESLGFRDYLENHSDRLPLEGAFPYSREELFRRRFLRALPPLRPGCPKPSARSTEEGFENDLAAHQKQSNVKDTSLNNETSQALSLATGKIIMFVLPKTAEFGGLERHLLDFVRRLNEPQLHVLIVCFDQDIISAHMDGDLQAQVAVKCEKQPESLLDWYRLIRQIHPAIIIFSYSWVEAFPWQAPVAALLAGVRRRFSIQHLIAHPPPPPIQGRSPRTILRRWIGRRARYLLSVNISGRVSNKTICVSNAVREVVVNSYRFPARKTITIHNGVSTSTFVPSKAGGADVRARLGVAPEDFLLVCVARLAEAKGVDILLQAVSRVVRQGISCKCIIIGDGPLKEKLLHQMHSLGLWDYVYFEGFQEDVRPYLQAASAFILTSRLEGLPLSVLEAMACGVPCIVTNVGGSAEAVKDQVVGLVIPPESVEAASDAILYLATHPRERAEMAGRTRETVVRSFDIENRMGELRSVILS